jgi:hypothetical protein
MTSKAGGTRRLPTGETAGYQPAVRQWAGIPSHYLRQVTSSNQDLTHLTPAFPIGCADFADAKRVKWFPRFGGT